MFPLTSGYSARVRREVVRFISFSSPWSILFRTRCCLLLIFRFLFCLSPLIYSQPHAPWNEWELRCVGKEDVM